MGSERLTVKQVIEALRDSRGIKTRAARKLNVDRHTIDNYIERHDSVRQAYEDERNAIVDTAEEGLVEKLDAKEWPAITFVLTTLGKDRGYVGRNEVTGEAGGPIVFKVEYDE